MGNAGPRANAAWARTNISTMSLRALPVSGGGPHSALMDPKAEAANSSLEEYRL